MTGGVDPALAIREGRENGLRIGCFGSSIISRPGRRSQSGAQTRGLGQGASWAITAFAWGAVVAVSPLGSQVKTPFKNSPST